MRAVLDVGRTLLVKHQLVCSNKSVAVTIESDGSCMLLWAKDMVYT